MSIFGKGVPPSRKSGYPVKAGNLPREGATLKTLNLNNIYAYAAERLLRKKSVTLRIAPGKLNDSNNTTDSGQEADTQRANVAAYNAAMQAKRAAALAAHNAELENIRKAAELRTGNIEITSADMAKVFEDDFVPRAAILKWRGLGNADYLFFTEHPLGTVLIPREEFPDGISEGELVWCYAVSEQADGSYIGTSYDNVNPEIVGKIADDIRNQRPIGCRFHLNYNRVSYLVTDDGILVRDSRASPLKRFGFVKNTEHTLVRLIARRGTARIEVSDRKAAELPRPGKVTLL